MTYLVEILKIVNHRVPAGFHSTTWDATNSLGELVPAGMYIYMIQSESYTKSIKMVLLK